MIRTLLTAGLLTLGFAPPAMALSCDDSDGIRIHGNIAISGGFHFGSPYTESELAMFDQMQLRRRGIDATRAERWAGCVRAWVRQPDGTETQQFFDPTSYEKLDLRLR